jgi:arylsulfatase A-like enzyme
MRRRRRLGLAALACLLAGCGAHGVSAPPDIVLVIGDDQGYTDFGFMGSTVAHTPRLDRLASQGTVFRVGYSTASVCRPALQTLLTGLEPLEYTALARALGGAGAAAPGSGDVVQRIDTLPRLLAQRGYASFQAGKHYEGSFAEAGFSEGMVTRQDREGRRAGEALVRETMQPVLDFVDRHRAQPFFLWFAPRLPHLPHDPPAEYLEPYRDTGLARPELLYFGSVTWFDTALGRLLDHLDSLGLGDRTLVVYLVDNGWEATASLEGSDYLLGGPRGKKSLHEIGFRTPIVFRWPGHVRAGATSDALVSILDVFPTLLDYAGAVPPPGRLGHSLRPALEGSGRVGRRALVGAMDGLRGDPPGGPFGGVFWRSPRWHYLYRRSGREALYDLRSDPGERRDVAAAHPGVVQRARGALRAWEDEMNQQLRRIPRRAAAP